MALTIDEAIVIRMTSQAGIMTSLNKIPVPDAYPQNEPLPAITYVSEDDRSIHTQQGPSALREAIYLICVWSETKNQAITLSVLVQQALDGFRGQVSDGESPENTMMICGSLMDNCDREFVADLNVWCVAMRFTIWYQRPRE